MNHKIRAVRRANGSLDVFVPLRTWKNQPIVTAYPEGDFYAGALEHANESEVHWLIDALTLAVHLNGTEVMYKPGENRFADIEFLYEVEE